MSAAVIRLRHLSMTQRLPLSQIIREAGYGRDGLSYAFAAPAGKFKSTEHLRPEKVSVPITDHDTENLSTVALEVDLRTASAHEIEDGKDIAFSLSAKFIEQFERVSVA